jgi:hypothetical protein
MGVFRQVIALEQHSLLRPESLRLRRKVRTIDSSAISLAWGFSSSIKGSVQFTET